MRNYLVKTSKVIRRENSEEIFRCAFAVENFSEINIEFPVWVEPVSKKEDM